MILWRLALRFRWSERQALIAARSIEYSKRRPQQDSNLRTRLRRPLPCSTLACANMAGRGICGHVSVTARGPAALPGRPGRPGYLTGP